MHREPPATFSRRRSDRDICTSGFALRKRHKGWVSNKPGESTFIKCLKPVFSQPEISWNDLGVSEKWGVALFILHVGLGFSLRTNPAMEVPPWWWKALRIAGIFSQSRWSHPTCGSFDQHMGVPQAGWFGSGKIPSQHGWSTGYPRYPPFLETPHVQSDLGSQHRKYGISCSTKRFPNIGFQPAAEQRNRNIVAYSTMRGPHVMLVVQ